MDINEYTSYCLKGKEKLWKVFWLWFVAVWCVLGILFEFLAPYALTNDTFMHYWLQWVFLVLMVYMVWILMSLWHCAFNATWKGWGYLVRLTVIMVAGLTITAMILPFTMNS